MAIYVENLPRIQLGQLEAASLDVEQGYQWVLGNGQTVLLESTPCNFGGVRWWLACPDCSRRSKHLYKYQGRYHCRECIGAVNRSSNLGRDRRHILQIRKIQKSLKLPSYYTITDALPNYYRKKGMHDETWARISHNYLYHQIERLNSFSRMFMGKDARLEPIKKATRKGF